MSKRLLEIAEGPIPSRESLEQEFGFHFKLRDSVKDRKEGIGTYYGTANSPPFGAGVAGNPSNIHYSDFKSEIVIAFRFDSKRVGINKTTDRYCVEGEFIFKDLIGKWKKFQKEQGHYPIVVNYTATFLDVERTVEVSPIYLSSETCINGLVTPLQTKYRQLNDNC